MKDLTPVLTPCLAVLSVSCVLALNHLAAGIIAFRKLRLKINIIYG